MILNLTAEQRGYLYGILGVIVFGLTLPATRLAVLELDPLFVATGRAVLAGLTAFAVVTMTRAALPARELWSPLVRYGVCVILGFPLLMTVAMRYAPAAHGGVILSILPLATAMAGVMVAGERPSRGFWLCGIAGSLAVMAFVMLKAGGTGTNAARGLHVADLMLVGAVLCAAWGYAEGAVVTRTLGGWQAISWALVFALPMMIALTLAVLVTGGLTGTAGLAMQASWLAWAGFLYVGLGSMYLGFFAWNRGLDLGGIAKVGQTQLLQTFVTLAGAAILLGEAVGPMELVFAAVVAALVALGSRMRVRR